MTLGKGSSQSWEQPPPEDSLLGPRLTPGPTARSFIHCTAPIVGPPWADSVPDVIGELGPDACPHGYQDLWRGETGKIYSLGGGGE